MKLHHGRYPKRIVPQELYRLHPEKDSKAIQ